MPPFTCQILLVCSLCVMAAIDFRSYRLPNWLTLPLMGLGWIWHSVAGEGAGLAWSLIGSLISLLPLLWFHLRGKMGAGDVKLMGAVGAWLGGWTGLHVLVVSGLAGVLCDLGYRWRHSRSPRPSSLSNSDRLRGEHVETALTDPELRRRWIPFSIPITLGVLVLVLFPGLMREPPERGPSAQAPLQENER